MGGLPHAEGQILGRARLDHVFGFNVALPFLLVVSTGTVIGPRRIGLGEIDLVALDVAGHKRQARHAEAGHVNVIANLDGPFVRAVEI
ncbi:hypothetical protein D3C78_1677670 [compost metagenome]